MPETTYELSTYKSLPIPDYLAPPGVRIIHDEKGGHVSFESKLDVNNMFMTSEYTERVQKFILSKYADILSQEPEKLAQLSGLYCASLAATFTTLEALYEQQAGLIKNGRWADADNMNLPDQAFSIPNQIGKLSFKSFLEGYMTRLLTRINPEFRRTSSAEQNCAIDLSTPEPDFLQVDIKDQETFAMMRSNGILEERMQERLTKLTENELLNLFLFSDEEQRSQSALLAPPLLTGNLHVNK